MKDRGFTDGIQQHKKYNEDNAASPTDLFEGILTTSSIEAHKGRYMATIDIPPVYLNTETYNYLIILLKWILE